MGEHPDRVGLRTWHDEREMTHEHPTGRRRGRPINPRMGARLAVPHRRPAPRRRGRRRARAPRSCCPAAATRASARSACCGRCSSASIVPDVVIGTSAGALNGAAICYAPNLTGVAQLAAVWEQLRSDHVFPGGQIHRAWNVVRRGTHLFESDGLEAAHPPQHAGPLVLRPRDPAPRHRDRPRHRRGGRARPRPAQARAPREHRAARRVPDRRTTTAAGSSTAASSTTCRSGTRSPGPVDRVFVLNVSSGVGRPRRALAARRRDDELHARAQPALRARAALRAARRSR